MPELDSEARRDGYPPLDALCAAARLVAHTFGCTPVCVATDGLVDTGFVVLGGPLDDEQRPVLVVGRVR